MRDRFEVVLFPLAAASGLCVLVFLVYQLSGPLALTLLFALVFTVGFIVAQSYARHRSAHYETAAANRRLLRENEGLKVTLQQQQGKIGALEASRSADGAMATLYQKMLDSAGAIIVMIDEEGKIAFINRKACVSLGYGAKDVMGKDWFAHFVPATVRKNAEAFFKSLISSQSSTDKQCGGIVVTRDGAERLIAWHNVLIRNEDDAVFMLSIGEDKTSRAEAEAHAQEVKDKRARSARIRSSGMLAEGIARAIGKVLKPITDMPESVIISIDELAGEKDTAGLRSSIATIADAGHTVKTILEDLMALGARTVSGQKSLSLNDVVASCVEDPAVLELKEANRNVSISTESDPNLLPINGSSALLSRALSILIARAFRSMPEGGRLTISTKNLYAGEDILKYEIIPAGEYAVLWVADSGKGLTRDEVDSIFEPSGVPPEKRNADGVAVDLGLAGVYAILKSHGGFAHVKSEPETGTEFILCFPVTRNEVDTADFRNMPRGDESILIVDDLEHQRTLARKLLTKLGYKVTVTESGRKAAVLFWDRSKSPFDLILLDMIMEEDFDGLDTYREIIRKFPNQKCIIVSGYAQSERAQQVGALGAGQFLPKPYTLEQLAKAVRLELDKPTS